MHPLTAAYAGFLAPLPARWMWTLTCREPSHPESIERAFRVAIKRVNQDLYGQDFNPKRHLGVGYVLGHERHKSGEPHAHAIVYAIEEDFDRVVQRRAHWQWWFEERGLNRLEPVRSAARAAGYTTKYVLKEGNIVFSENFGAFVKLYGEQ